MKIGGNMNELEIYIVKLDGDISLLKRNENVPPMIIDSLLEARKYLVKALEILNEGGDY